MIRATSSHDRMRKLADKLFRYVTIFMALVGVTILVTLLAKLVIDGTPRLSQHFLTSMPKQTNFNKAGILSAIVGSGYIMILTFLISVPVGVAAAIYLEEMGLKKSRFSTLIQININNLAGVPSIVYGMLGLAVFVPLLTSITKDPMQGRGLLTGALTMSILILPIIILVSQESLRAVPSSYREAALALGATRWQAIAKNVLPPALPGILTGVIIAMGRAIGETAPLIVVGAASLVTFLPKGLTDGYMVLPLQIYDWASRPQAGFHQLAASAILVLVAVLLLLNSGAIILRARTQR